MASEEEIKYCVCNLSPDLPYIELYAISDLHYGNPFCDLKAFCRQVDYINSKPEAYVILNGDLCEAATKLSKGDIYRQVGTPQDQRDRVIEMLLPIKDKVLGMDSGNHEDRICTETGVDISKDIASALGCWYDPDGLFLNLRFGHGNKDMPDQPWSYDLYAMHGYGGARTKGGRAAKLERMSYWVAADIYIQSHDHDVMAFPQVFLSKHRRTFQQDGYTVGTMVGHRALLVKSNAYLKWGGYARRGGFPPVDLITPTIWLSGHEKPWPGVQTSKSRRKPEVRVIV